MSDDKPQSQNRPCKVCLGLINSYQSEIETDIPPAKSGECWDQWSKRNFKLPYERKDLFHFFPALKEASDQGCHLCDILMKQFQDPKNMSIGGGCRLQAALEDNKPWLSLPSLYVENGHRP
jgi:hypothetical protein